MKRLFCLLATVTLALASAQAQSTFTITLDGSQETPPNASTATGTGTATLTGNILDITVSYSGLDQPPSTGAGAHIHGPAPAGTAAGILFHFDVAGKGTTDTISAQFTYSPTEITDLLAGLHYVNIHNITFGPGEIRGQILLVPEPSTIALGGLGLGALLLAMRRRK